MGDWFGILTSGVPQGYGDDAFYWSDVFHYRRTYQFPFVLYQQAQDALASATTDTERMDAESRIAFAVGWMTHCATDVTGHAFTNAKTGGPYRDHWQRHHLTENHFDSQNYSALHPGPLYDEYGTSALHFWISFRTRSTAPYSGRSDAPAYDYWTALPAYDNSDGPTGAAHRRTFFDLGSNPLPQHLTSALLDAMADVHPDGPRILMQDPQFSATDTSGNADGRPNDPAMQQMWDIVYTYLKMTASSGISLRLPPPPSVFTDHSFPTPPGGGGAGIDDDPNRGADVDDNSSFTLLDLLLALFAWAVYIAEVITWLVTVLPGLITDVATFPARQVVYWAVIVPAWNLYILARRALVMAGFVMPMAGEVDLGLTTLGTSTGTFSIANALDDPLANGLTASQITEPSGRATATSPTGIDGAYPRGIVRDKPADITRPDLAGALGLTGPVHYACGDRRVQAQRVDRSLALPARPTRPEWGSPRRVRPPMWVRTWSVTSRPSCSPGCSGPTTRGRSSRSARRPRRPPRPSTRCWPSTSTSARLSTTGSTWSGGWQPTWDMTELGVPDFNLDADRGYAWHCWDWDRHHAGKDPADPGARGTWECIPRFTAVPIPIPPPPKVQDFRYRQPCSPPQFFHADFDNPDPAGSAFPCPRASGTTSRATSWRTTWTAPRPRPLTRSARTRAGATPRTAR